jgi:RNA polymerase sigma factor (sigma-70 family)
MSLVFDPNTLAACRMVVQRCNQQHGWQLDALTVERYAYAMTPLLTGIAVERWPFIVLHYHLDHRVVAALSDAQHSAHDELWAHWSQQVIGILRHAGRDWAQDSSVELDDLAQVARSDLAQALPSYRYQSRLRSWAYSVVVRSAQRHMRMLQAQRRSATLLSLDAPTTPVLIAPPEAIHEQATHASLLAERVHAVLAAHDDPRLLPIFRLWAVDGYTSAEIGALVKLHASRVRALLSLARSVLRDDPAIQEWHPAAHDQADESAPER